MDEYFEQSVLINTIAQVKAFVDLTNAQPFNIDVISGRFTVSGNSLLGLFSLDLSKPVTVRVYANESKANELFAKVQKL